MRVIRADVRDEFDKLMGLAKKARIRLKNALDDCEGIPDEEWCNLFRWVIDAHVRVSSEQRQWAKQDQGETSKLSEQELIEQIRNVLRDMPANERAALLTEEAH